MDVIVHRYHQLLSSLLSVVIVQETSSFCRRYPLSFRVAAACDLCVNHRSNIFTHCSFRGPNKTSCVRLDVRRRRRSSCRRLVRLDFDFDTSIF